MNSQKIQSYTGRLISCGISQHEALRIIYSFQKEFNEKDLLSYIESIEKDRKNVD